MAYSQQVQAPLDYDGTRIPPGDFRRELANQSQEISAGVRRVADATPTPDKERNSR